VIGLFAATLGLLGNIAVAYVNNRNSQQVERQRAQSNLVFEGIKTGNPETACKNLVFFLDLGLLDDPNQAIRQACKADSKVAPSLPRPGATNIVPGGIGLGSDYASAVVRGRVEDADSGAPIEHAKVIVPLWSSFVTDDTGFFSFSAPSIGLLLPKVQIEKEGYITLTAEISSFNEVMIFKLHKAH
jgi:hypothetical protein